MSMGKNPLLLGIMSLFCFVSSGVVLFSIASLSAQSSKCRIDGSRRERYAVPEDDLYKSPIQLALSQDGERLYVVCENADEVLVLDTKNRKIVDKVAVGEHPFGVALSPDESRLYVSNRWDDSVSVVDTDSMQVVRTFPAGDDPHGLATDLGERTKRAPRMPSP